jgi:ribonucleoside-diphosphate reductase alpha chain
MSVALQHGVPLQVMTEKLAHTRFEPSGWTVNEKMGYTKSPMDYLGRWM